MTRLRTALIPAYPTLLTVPVLAALAAADLAPWSVLFSVAAALAVLAAVRHKRGH
ncbi:hypothetical protein [Streptomyces klenkii]|uniref:hypothetical protein n=1 Tax=Streptomyces klenkii TaxID=1420899 RepID=UPI0018F2C6F6|nr:hypothetical protein [Streptomyces klenkii]